jgi:hypothetical protein
MKSEDEDSDKSSENDQSDVEDSDDDTDSDTDTESDKDDDPNPKPPTQSSSSGVLSTQQHGLAVVEDDPDESSSSSDDDDDSDSDDESETSVAEFYPNASVSTNKKNDTLIPMNATSDPPIKSSATDDMRGLVLDSSTVSMTCISSASKGGNNQNEGVRITVVRPIPCRVLIFPSS